MLEFFEYLRERKRWALAPLLLALLVLTLLTVASQATPIAPLLYAFF
jgi:hypothetical protein